MKKILLSLTLIAATFQGCYFTAVDSGEVGVQISQGKVQEDALTEGFNFSFNPFASLILYNTKAKQLELSGVSNGVDTNELIRDSAITIIDKDGMQIPVDLTIIYRLDGSKAPIVRRKFGADIVWDNKMVVPVAKDVIKAVMQKDANIYRLNQNREAYATSIASELEKAVNDGMDCKCVTIERVSITDIKIPASINESIIKKNQMQEESLRAELELRQAEAKAKIEIAQKEGTAKAQLALAKSITPEMIRWKELEIAEDAVKKWNGTLPSTNLGSNAIPFVNIK